MSLPFIHPVVYVMSCNDTVINFDIDIALGGYVGGIWSPAVVVVVVVADYVCGIKGRIKEE